MKHRRWVVFRLSSLGDVALLTGVLDYWRRTRGFSFIVVTAEDLAVLFDNHPAVEAIESISSVDLRGKGLARRMAEIADRYPGAGLIDLHGKFSASLATRFWRSWPGEVKRYPKFSLLRRIFGLCRPALFRRWLERLNVPQRYSLALESQAPDPQELRPVIKLDPSELNAARELLALKMNDLQAPLIALHPFATHPNKAWPVEHWRRLCQALDKAGIAWFVVGRTPEDERFLDAGNKDLTNATDLRQLCALLAHAQLLITGDSGPMHLATAVGTPVLALFGPTVKAWGFYPTGEMDRVLERHDLSCRPCSLHGGKDCERRKVCLSEIAVEWVVQEMEAMLQAIRKP